MKELLILYLIPINILSIVVMVYDKRNAIKGKWRIAENTLLLYSIIGGSIGILASMYLLRHKTKKFRFKFGVPFIILIQLAFILFFKIK